MFIDEPWAKTNMKRLRGRFLKGARLVARVPHGHWKTCGALIDSFEESECRNHIRHCGYRYT